MYNYDIKFISCDETLNLKKCDFKSYKYETKKKSEENVYETAKRNFCERGGGHWRAPKLSQIRKLECKLKDRNVVFCDWSNESYITIVFSLGSIAYLTVKTDTLDVTQVLFDRYCVGKLSGQTVSGVAFSPSHLLFTHADKATTLVTFGKRVSGAVPVRISDREPHVQSLELGGWWVSERRVSWSYCGVGGAVTAVALWGAARPALPAPWSPAAEDLANLHLYLIHGQQVTLTGCHQLEHETLCVELSQHTPHQLHVVEQRLEHRTAVSLRWLRGEMRGALQVPAGCGGGAALPAPARSVRLSPCESRLVAACLDGSLHVLHCDNLLLHSHKAGNIGAVPCWAGELVITGDSVQTGRGQGRLHCYDRALTPLHHHAKCIDLAPYTRSPRGCAVLGSRRSAGGVTLLCQLSPGPLVLLRVTHPDLITSWIRAGRVDAAVSLLRAMDWETEGPRCLAALQRVVIAALRSGRGAGAQAALGTYLAPAVPHGRKGNRYAPPVVDLARKYCHYLLRRGELETALSLGVDIGAWDLFADAAHAADRLQDADLAREARDAAMYYAQAPGESECSSSCSQCSSTASDSPPPPPPPPARRLCDPPPLPALTAVTVPAPAASPSAHTRSIRPNLHQYVERGNTIWTTDRATPTSTATESARHYKKHCSVVNLTQPHNKVAVVDVIPHEIQGPRFHSIFQTELREEATGNNPQRNLYNREEQSASCNHHRYLHVRDEDVWNTNNYQQARSEETPGCNRYVHKSEETSGSTSYRHKSEDAVTNRYQQDRRNAGEKNKVKFSDTVTVTVVSNEGSPGARYPDTSRELAESLPLSLAAFTPRPPPPLAEQAEEKPLKIKVVHFGMV